MKSDAEKHFLRECQSVLFVLLLVLSVNTSLGYSTAFLPLLVTEIDEYSKWRFP